MQLAQLGVETGRRKGRRLVADDHGAATAARLDGLADVVLDVGIEHRQIAQREEGVIARGQTPILAGQPFLGAVGAEVDQGIGLELLAKCLVGRQIKMIGWDLAVVIGLARTTGTGWLRHQQQLAEARGGNDELRLPVDFAQGPVLGGFAPAFEQRLSARLGQSRQPALVGRQRQGFGQVVGQQLVERVRSVVAAE